MGKRRSDGLKTERLKSDGSGKTKIKKTSKGKMTERFLTAKERNEERTRDTARVFGERLGVFRLVVRNQRENG